MEDFGRGWFGRKMPDCHLMFDRGRLLQAIRAPVSRDDVIRTWVHESLHGRQPYSRDHRQEADRWPGHEEGLAEGLARTLTGGIADMDIGTGSYAYYVAVYEALADVAGIDPERVLRGVWQAAPGDVRATLIDTVDTLRQDAWGRPLMAVQRQRLRALADTAFATERAKWLAGDRQALVRTWRVVLP